MEVCNTVVQTITNLILNSIGHQIGYMIHYKDNIEKLEKQIQRLETMKTDVEERIITTRRKGEDISAVVESWVEQVEAATTESNTFLTERVRKNKKCLGGLCINLSTHYQLSREAKDKALAIDELLVSGKFEGIEFSHVAPTPGIEISSFNKHMKDMKSRMSTVNEIMQALEDESVHILGMCGMGGVGKSTLARQIGKLAKESKMFDVVAFVVVSQTPSVVKIQDEISHMLGMKLHGDLESERARSLLARIQKDPRKILVILDDVWHTIDLETDIGVPYDDHKCKVLLTCRIESICDEMEADRVFPIAVLPKEEAWKLFKEMAGEEAVESRDLYSIAREVAAECGGLPLAIVMVGRALRNKKKDVWVSAAQQLQKSIPTNISGMIKDVYGKLKLSYDYLESKEAKFCFLLCCLYPEDYDIPLEELARYGYGLEIFRTVDTIHEARGRVHTAVSTLITSFLLLDGQKEGYVKMHDVVRDVAIYIVSNNLDGSNNFLVRSGANLRKWPQKDSYESCTGISIMSNNIRELPTDDLVCPNLQFLLIQHNPLTRVPDSCFKGLDNLKVLDMSGSQLKSIPSSLTSLANALRTLCLNGCKLGDISSIGRLSKLVILSFAGSDINEIPADIGQLKYLKLLDLRECEVLNRIAPGVISRFRRLEELYVDISFENWNIKEEKKEEDDDDDEEEETLEEILEEVLEEVLEEEKHEEQENIQTNRGNTILDELEELNSLTCLEICMPNAKLLPKDLYVKDLIMFNIAIGDTIYSSAKNFTCKRNLRLALNGRSQLLCWVKELLKKTESLVLIGFKSMKNIFEELDHDDGFNNLKCLHLESCNQMEYLVNTMREWAPETAFSNLDQLMIHRLNNFREICHGKLLASSESFGQIRVLELGSCHRMLCAVPYNLMQRLQKLHEFEATYCDSMEHAFEVVEGGTVDDLVANHDQAEGVKLLPILETLRLEGLPNLMHIWKLTGFRDANADDQQSNSNNYDTIISLSKLKHVKVYHCHVLMILFPPQLVQSLVHLEDLEISYCPCLEQVFGTMTMAEIVLPPLSPPSFLQNLTKLKLQFCENLTSLFKISTISKGLEQLRKLKLESCARMHVVVEDDDGGGGHDEEKKKNQKKITLVLFPRLSSLTLDGMDSLKYFCNGHYTIEWPSLDTLNISRCPMLRKFGRGHQETPKLEEVEFATETEPFKGDLNATLMQRFKETRHIKLPSSSSLLG